MSGPINENELRIAGAERALIALAAHVQPRDVQASIHTLTQELGRATDDDERTSILQAIQLLEDGLSRWDEFSAGRVLWPPR